MKYKFSYLFLASLFISFLATIHLSLLTEGFIMTISVAFLPFFVYFNKHIDILGLCFFTAFISPFIRFISLLGDFSLDTALEMTFPDVFFYLVYGIIFHFFYERSKRKSTLLFLAGAFISDLSSNLLEIAIRSGVAGLSFIILKTLFFIALIRTLILFILIFSIRYYKSFLVHEEHDARYRYLLHLTSTFKSEVYFMQKNMSHIEKVMEQSFRAYRLTEKEDYPPELKSSLLDLTKEVHEIKKNYIRVIQGISNSFPELAKFSDLNLQTIIELLSSNVEEQIKGDDLIQFKYSIAGNSFVKSHYYFMSILTNLIQNAIESSKSSHMNLIHLNVTVDREVVYIMIKDSGSGVPAEHLDYIFSPGFSTKYNPDTGNINRGVGLSMVKDLVESKFKGSIQCKSIEERGTSFHISIPKKVLQGG